MRDYAKTVNRLRNWPRICAEYKNSVDELHDDAADAIEELLAIKEDLDCTVSEWQQMYDHDVPTWISVEERLPSRYETVLLNIQTCKDSYVTIGDYEPNELRFRDFADRNNQVYCGDIVTHWMPLPAPPKGVE